MLAACIAAFGFVLIALGLPGAGVQRICRVAIDPALVLPIGLAFAAGSYWIGLVLGQPWVFPVLIAGAAAAGLLGLWRGPRAPGPALPGVLPPLAAVLLFLAVTAFPWNVYGPQHEFILDPLVPYDTAFHVGLARELTIGYPPQVPGVSGFPLGYHLGADLVRAAALRWAGVDPYDTITRVDTVLGAVALALLLRSITVRLRAPALAVALAPWTLLATDFSFAFARNPQAHWWTDLLRGNLLLSLDLANPIVPALALALGALLALDRHRTGEGAGWLALAALQAAAVPFFKVFLGGHLLLGLGAVVLLGTPPARRGALLLAAPALLATAALVLGQGGRTVEVAWAPLDLASITRETLGLAPARGWALAAWAAAWLVLSLGLRVAGVPAALGALRGGEALPVALGAMALAGWPLGLLLRVSAPAALAGQKVVNDAAFLVEQSGPLLWIFTAIAVARVAVRRGSALAVVGAAALLALPSTAQFVVEKSRWPNQAIPAARVRAMAALANVSRPGDVVLQRPGGRYPPAPVVLIGRRVPYERFTPWLTQFAAPEDLEARHEVVHRFFTTTDAAEAVAIARGLNARFVCLYEGERVRFPTDGFFEPITADPDARVYRLAVP